MLRGCNTFFKSKAREIGQNVVATSQIKTYGPNWSKVDLRGYKHDDDACLFYKVLKKEPEKLKSDTSKLKPR